MRLRARNKQEGVMLLEALIGILIFSIGILAMLGMQAIGMRATIDAKYRSEASYLANQVIGQMWVDRTNLPNYATTGPAYAPRDEWVARVDATLPRNVANLATTTPVIAVAGQQVTITVRWMRQGDDAVSQHVAIAQIVGPS